MFQKFWNKLFPQKKPKYYAVFTLYKKDIKIAIFEENYIPNEKLHIQVNEETFYKLNILEIQYISYNNLKEVLVICERT